MAQTHTRPNTLWYCSDHQTKLPDDPCVRKKIHPVSGDGGYDAIASVRNVWMATVDVGPPRFVNY